MSVSIDKKVVEMRFDNSDFERKVTETLQTLKLLQTTLDNTESAKSLRGLSDAVDGINFRGLNGALDTIEHRFSTLGIIGMTVIQNITNSALNAAKNVLSAVESSIIHGGITRATNIENAKFMLEGLGVAWKDIAEDIDYGVKDTAYSLDAAAKAASSLVASGVKLGDEMKTSLRGISGVAAMTNSDYESISNIFTTVAGQNRLMTMQLRQLEGRGLNAAATLKDYFNRSTESLDKFYTLYNSHKKKNDPAIIKGAQATEEAIRTMVTNGAIDFQLFSDAMDSTFGQHAKDANKTFNGAMSNIKSALARIGAEFVQPLIQNEGPLVGMLNAIRVKINDVKNEIIPFAKESTDALNNLFTNLASKIESADLTNHFTILRNLVDIFKNTLSGLWSVLKIIGSAFKEAFPISISSILVDLTSKIKAFTDRMKLSDDTSEKLKNTFRGLFSLLNIGKQILSALSTPLSFVVQIFGSLGRALLGVTSSIGNFITKISQTTDKMNFFKNIFSSFHPDTSGFEESIDTVTSKLSPLELLLTGISKVINGIGTVITTAAKIIKKAAGIVVEVLSNLFTGISKSLKETNGSGAARLFNSGLLIILLQKLKEFTFAAKGFIQQHGPLTSTIKGIAENIRNMGNNLNASLTQLQKNLRVKNLKTIATAVLELAVACLLLASIDDEKLTSSLAAVTTMIGELMLTLKALDDISGTGIKEASGSVKLLKGMATAILILSISIKVLATIPFNDLMKGVLAVTILLTELTTIAFTFSKFESSFTKASASMILMALALKMLVKPVVTLGTMDFTSLMQGILGVTILLTELTAIAFIFSKFESSFIKAAASMILMALALKMLVNPIVTLGTMDLNSLLQGGIAVTAMLAVLTAVAFAMGSVAPVMILGAVGLLVMSVALLALIPTMKVLASMGGGDIAKVILSIGSLLLTLAVGLTAMILALPGAAALVVAAKGLLVLSAALLVLNTMSFGELLKSLGMMVTMFLTISVIGTICGVLSPLLLAFGVSMGIVAAATAVLALALATLAVSGLAGMIALKTIVTEFILLIPNICLALGEAIAGLCTTLIATMPLILELVFKIVVGICDTIIRALPKISETLIEVVNSLCEVLLETVPVIVDTGLQLLVALLQGIADHIGDVVETAISIVVNLLNGIASKIEDVIAAGVNLAMSFIEGIVKQIPVIVDRAGKLVISFLNGLADAIRKNAQGIHDAAKNLISAFFESMITLVIGSDGVAKFKELGKNIVDGIGTGIAKCASAVKDIAKKLGKALLDAVKSFLGIKSPSKEFAKIGMYSDQGLAGGLKKYSKSVVLAAKNLASDTFDTIDGGLSGLSRIISSKINDDPTIRPILDLSSVENGARRINGLLSNQYAMAVAAEGTIGIQNGSGSTTINMTINGAQGQDINQLADIIEKRINDSVRRRVNVWK